MYTFQASRLTTGPTYTATISSTTDAGEDPAVFVVQKTSATPASPTVDNLLFEDVASPTDMITYTSTEIFPGLYRTANLYLYFDTLPELNAIVDTILKDAQDMLALSNILNIVPNTLYTSVHSDVALTNNNLTFTF